MIRYSLEHADRNLPHKNIWFLKKVTSLSTFFLCSTDLLLFYFAKSSMLLVSSSVSLFRDIRSNKLILYNYFFQVCGASSTILRILYFSIMVGLAILLAFRHRPHRRRTQSPLHIDWPSIRHMWLAWYPPQLPTRLNSHPKSLWIAKDEVLRVQLLLTVFVMYSWWSCGHCTNCVSSCLHKLFWCSWWT